MRKTSAILLAAALPMAVQAANTEFTYGGFIKFDAMYSQYNDGAAANAGALEVGRDFYVPAAIPTGNGEKTSATDFTARSSRFNFKTVTTLDNGEKVTGFVELDFLTTTEGDERASNSFAPRLRHAYFSYNNVLVGQTWTTFMNVGALPEMVDFFGVSEGTVFGRQSQFRYTMGNLQLALENPESTIGGARGGDEVDQSKMPDLIARYNIAAGEHSFSVAGIVRQLSDDDGAGNDDSAMGYGVNVAGVVKLGADDLKFSVTHGQVARYVGLGATAADAVMVGADIEPTDVTAAFVAYRHFWNPKLRSTVAYSMLDADYEGAGATTLIEKSQSARINLMYSPVKEVTYGVEYSNSKIEKDDNTDGTMDRLQFTAKYSF